MAKELSEEIGSLADLTARGRSLGVHLLLATQKPSTAVNTEIRTNTRLRISLRVEDKQDSADVVGIPDAAPIRHTGRGYVRVGQGEVIPIQSALSTATAQTASELSITVSPFLFGERPTIVPVRPPETDSQTDLDLLTAAIADAFAASGASLPRKPWPDPLPDSLPLDSLSSGTAPDDDLEELHFALADDPDAQTQYPIGWPLRDGNLLLYGVVGSGTTTALSSIALAFATQHTVEQGHLYVIDFGAGDLISLSGLPHCAAIVGAGDSERQVRLIRRLQELLAQRRRLSPAERRQEPRILVLVDNFEAFRSAYENVAGAELFEAFLRVYADGPEARISIAGSVTRAGGVSSLVSTTTPNKLMFRLADSNEYGSVGLTRDQIPTFVPGRAVVARTGRVIQVARPTPSLADHVARLAASMPASKHTPPSVNALPATVSRGPIVETSRGTSDRWELGVGIRDSDLEPVSLVLYEGEHALVAGPARSGKSSALLTLIESMHHADPTARVFAVAYHRSPLRESQQVSRFASTTDELNAMFDEVLVSGGGALVVVDDAEIVDDDQGRLAQLLTGRLPGVHVLAAGKNDALRTLWGHWTQTVRRSRTGLLLQPNLDSDGDLLGTRLPNRGMSTCRPGGASWRVTGTCRLSKWRSNRLGVTRPIRGCSSIAQGLERKERFATETHGVWGIPSWSGVSCSCCVGSGPGVPFPRFPSKRPWLVPTAAPTCPWDHAVGEVLCERLVTDHRYGARQAASCGINRDRSPIPVATEGLLRSGQPAIRTRAKNCAASDYLPGGRLGSPGQPARDDFAPRE